MSIRISQMKYHSISVDQSRYVTYIVAKYLDTDTVKASTKFYKTTFTYDMIFTKADASTSDEQVEKLTRELNINYRYCIGSLIHISRSLLIQIFLLEIRLWRNLNFRDGGIIGRVGVTSIGGYLMGIDVWRGIYVTEMAVRFDLGGGPATVNRVYVTDLYRITTHSFFYLDMFYVWIIHNNDDCLG